MAGVAVSITAVDPKIGVAQKLGPRAKNEMGTRRSTLHCGFTPIFKNRPKNAKNRQNRLQKKDPKTRFSSNRQKKKHAVYYDLEWTMIPYLMRGRTGSKMPLFIFSPRWPGFFAPDAHFGPCWPWFGKSARWSPPKHGMK